MAHPQFAKQYLIPGSLRLYTDGPFEILHLTVEDGFTKLLSTVLRSTGLIRISLPAKPQYINSVTPGTPQFGRRFGKIETAR